MLEEVDFRKEAAHVAQARALLRKGWQGRGAGAAAAAAGSPLRLPALLRTALLCDWASVAPAQ